MILASEVMPAFEETIAGVPESELARIPEVHKKAFIARLLRERIKTKLIYQDARRTIPAERLSEIEDGIGDYFDKEELPKRIEKAGVASRAELDQKLHAIGSSLERTKRAFVQQMLARQWLYQQNTLDAEVSHDEMLEYYREHVADFETSGRARWEQLSIRIPRYSDGSEAYAALANLGNQVIAGTPTEDVLRAQPEGPLQCSGGVHGWTTQGSLEVSRAVEQAIFGLPVGQLSRIFRDDDELHIVRVLEREEARRAPFEEAQAGIRKKIEEARRQEQIEAYLARLGEQTPVWTVFDDDPELARLRSESDPSRN